MGNATPGNGSAQNEIFRFSVTLQEKPVSKSKWCRKREKRGLRLSKSYSSSVVQLLQTWINLEQQTTYNKSMMLYKKGLQLIAEHSVKTIGHQNREFYDHFPVDDIYFTGIFGKLQIVFHGGKGILIEIFDISDLLTLWLSLLNTKHFLIQ